MLVSIVMLCRRPSSFAAAALQSIVEQDYDDIELLVIDDASGEPSSARLRTELDRPANRRRFKGRIALMANADPQGVGRSFNRAVASARGDIVCLLDADDRFCARRLERIVAALGGGASDWATTAVRAIDSNDGDLVPEHPFAEHLRALAAYVKAMPAAGFAFARYDVGVTAGNLAFRRALFDAVGGFRPLDACAGWDFGLRALLHREPIFIDAPLYDHRIGDATAAPPADWLVRVEADSMLRAFFAALRAERYSNPLAPSPRNWPGIFERATIEGARWPYWADIR